MGPPWEVAGFGQVDRVPDTPASARLGKIGAGAEGRMARGAAATEPGAEAATAPGFLGRMAAGVWRWGPGPCCWPFRLFGCKVCAIAAREPIISASALSK